MSQCSIHPVHHINLVVPDLARATPAFAAVTRVQPTKVEYLPDRYVALQRFKLAGLWLVLVAPTDDRSPAADWLAAKGPGLFLLSFEVGDLDTALAELAEHGVSARGPSREGLDDWQVQDIGASDLFGIPLQLTQSNRSNLENGDE